MITTSADGTLINTPLWTVGLSVLPDVYTIQVEDPRNPGTYISYDSFEIQAPIISVQKTTSTPSVSAGSNVSYSIQIQNTGNITGSLTNIVDNLPSSFSYVTGSATGLTTANPAINGSQLTWLGTWSVPVAGSVTLYFNAIAGGGGNHYNNVTIGGDNFAVMSTGPTALIAVTGPTLTLSKTVDKTSAAPGDTITYTVHYSNTGDGDATYVFILESIPTNTEYVTDSAVGAGTTITYSHNGGISYDTSQAAPVTSLSFQCATTLTPGAGGSIAFKVKVK
ncbi:MAG: hypothetical protein M0R34_01825 [Candidatus Marinimicrobia bacterium]|nr:hypothetical protein [Candidatus Neomarinimicrobiota bacterium]MCK9559066.1 hypothetical protein [Candidatus Neomarinimicrobiota bacterium]